MAATRTRKAGPQAKRGGRAAAPPATRPVKSKPAGPLSGGHGTHFEHEDVPWEVEIPDHEPRKDSELYVKSRLALHNITKEASAQRFMYPLLSSKNQKSADGYQDHHGGGMWVVDDDGWLFIKNMAGMEWSSQFCADPKKVDNLRQFAQRVYAKFPGSLEKIVEMNPALGSAADLQKILDTTIEDAKGVSQWVDSPFNANVPLNGAHHTGFITSTKSTDTGGEPVGGVHHYPTPITDIQFIKFDDFKMWVTDPVENQPIAVTPADRRGKGDGRLRLAYATPGTKLNEHLRNARANNTNILVKADSSVAREAYAQQGGPRAKPTPPPPEAPPSGCPTGS
jgi:Family of unknown function (DUF6424)